MIIEGTLAPGARIHEGHLGQELGVSRTPLREALKYLARFCPSINPVSRSPWRKAQQHLRTPRVIGC